MLDHTELLGHVWGAYSRVLVQSAGTPPSMPRTASLSQHALATSPSRRALGPLIITWFISSYPQPSLILSLSPVLLPKIPFLWSKHYIWGRCAFKEKETSSNPASKINLTNTPGEVCFDIYIAQKYFFLKWSIFLFFTLHPCSDLYLSRKYYEDI